MGSIRYARKVLENDGLGGLLIRSFACLYEVLADIAGVHLPTFAKESHNVHQLFSLWFHEPVVRDGFREHLAEHGIPSPVTYDLVNLTRYYRSKWGWAERDLPVIEAVSDRFLLVFHLDLDTGDLDRIADRVWTFFRAYE